MEEDSSLEWEIMDYYSPPLETEEESNLGWIVNRGLSLGKNLVVAGVVISSVPIILPPIVVISALGFAVSVPFGVAFASYACSEKLMSKLLPSPTPPLDYYETDQWPEYEDEELQISIEKEEKEQREAIKDEVEMRIESVDDELRDGIKNEQDSFVSPDEFTNKMGYLDVVDGCIEGKDDVFLEGNEDEKPLPDGIGISGEATKTAAYDGICERQKNEKVEEVVFEMNEKKHETVSKGKSSSKDGGKREKRKALTALKFPGKRKHQEGQKMDSLVETKTSSENNLNSKEGMFGQGENQCAEVVVQENSRDEVGNIDGSLEKEQKPVELKDGAVIVGVNEEDDGSAVSIKIRDEKIWEKIESIRVIVGVKAPRRPSYFEEVKALYLFTGIEPPSSSSSSSSLSVADPSDLAEFYDKLYFLMSVIGVK